MALNLGIAPLDFLSADGLDAAVQAYAVERAAKDEMARRREELRWLAENIGIATANALSKVLAAMQF